MTARAPIAVNGTTLLPQAIAEEAQNHPAQTPAGAFQQAARALVIRALLLEEAQRQETPAVPELVAPGKRETPDEARVRRLIEDNVAAIEPDEPACRAFYEAHSSRFRSPDLFEASHILFAAHPHDGDGYRLAASRAEATLGELVRAPDLFDALARERSDCGSKVNGGRLGQLMQGEIAPEVEAVLRVLEEGQIAGAPVMSRFGAHIVRLDKRKLGERLPFDPLHEKIALLLAEQDWRRNVAAYIDGLIRRARIEGIDMHALTKRDAPAT